MFENMVADSDQQSLAIQKSENERDRKAGFAQQGYGPVNTGFTPEMMDKLLQPSITLKALTRGDINDMILAIMHEARRCPCIEPQERRRVLRDLRDTLAENRCAGRRMIVRDRMVVHLIDLDLLSADGNAAINGITNTSAIISQRLTTDTHVKMDDDQKPPRKKLFGLV